jgi:hypothetical protein
MDQIRVDPEKLSQAFQPGAGLTEARRYRRLGVFFIKFPVLHAEEPTQIKAA